MSLGHGASVVREGLVLHLDAANVKSYNPNLLQYGNRFLETTWSTGQGIIISSTTEIAPDGTNTATEIIDNNISGYSVLSTNLSVPNDNQSYKFSIYVKKTTESSPRFAINSGITGGSSPVQTNQRLEPFSGIITGAFIIDEGDWWRLHWNINNNNTGNTYLYFNIYPATQLSEGGGDNVSITGSAIIWGAMVTRGPTLIDYKKDMDNSGNQWRNLENLSIITSLQNGISFDQTNNGSILFDGVNDYVDVGSDQSYNAIENLTVEVLFNRIAVGTGFYQVIASNTRDCCGIYDGFQMHISNSTSNLSNLVCNLWNSDNYDGVSWSTSYTSMGLGGVIGVNEWYHACFTYDISSSNYKGYLNGILKSSISKSNALSTNQASYNLMIGKSPSHGANFTGYIPKVRVYNRALTELEIKQNFEALRGRYGI